MTDPSAEGACPRAPLDALDHALRMIEGLDAYATLELSALVASIPLASSGARPGAVSMPDVAITPGAQ